MIEMWVKEILSRFEGGMFIQNYDISNMSVSQGDALTKALMEREEVAGVTEERLGNGTCLLVVHGVIKKIDVQNIIYVDFVAKRRIA
jgi:threonine/homoserine efflux transporter RhtA